MPDGYLVERHTTGREVYYVLADSPEEAAEQWMEGELQVSEVLDSEPYSVKEAKE